MKILQLTTWYSPRIGGVESHVKRLTEELEKLGCEIQIFTLTKTHEPLARSFRYLQIPSLPYGFGLLPSPSVFSETVKNDADVIHCHAYGWPLAWTAALAKKKHGKPFVYTTHADPYSKVYSLMDLTRAVPARYCDRLIALTKQEAEHMGRIGIPSSRISVIPNGFDSPNPGSKPIDEPYVLCIGRIEFRHKGQDLLLAAYRKTRVSQNLVFVGDGPDLARLKTLSRGMPNVRIVGAVDEQDKGRWMSNAELVVVPSRTEPFGIVALEALSLNRRLVVTRVGGLQHVAGPFATMVDPNPTDIARGLLDALHGPLPIIPKDFAEHYSWERVAGNVLEIYRSLTESKAPAVRHAPSSQIEP